MNVATQITAERLAKGVVERANAIDALAKRTRPLSWWQYVVLVAFGSAWGWYVSSSTPHATLLIGIASGIGVALGAGAFRECINLRRRLDAALVLLRPDVQGYLDGTQP